MMYASNDITCGSMSLQPATFLCYFEVKKPLPVGLCPQKETAADIAVNFLQNYAYVHITRHAKQQSPRQFRKNFEYTIKPNDCHLSF